MNTQQEVLLQTTDEATRWQAVLDRDTRYDGAFVTAVLSTGIYCRPSCPARKPKRENVVFYAQNADAENAGFRPCKRCRPTEIDAQVALAQDICQYIDTHLDESITLETLGTEMHTSPFHLQRIFKRVMGISPRQYADAQRTNRLKSELKTSDTVTEAVYEAGYGSSSRVYERASSRLGMSPGTYARGGQNRVVHYTIVDSPLGRLLVGATERGVCAISLGDDDITLENALRAEYPAADLQRDDADLGVWVSVLLEYLTGQQPRVELPLDVQATAFQWQVWHALQAIPAGETRSYSEVAVAIGNPKAVRAVANACANNRVALAIPCHRVIREDGNLGGYRWGIERKETLLKQEREIVIQAE